MVEVVGSIPAERPFIFFGLPPHVLDEKNVIGAASLGPLLKNRAERVKSWGIIYDGILVAQFHEVLHTTTTQQRNSAAVPSITKTNTSSSLGIVFARRHR